MGQDRNSESDSIATEFENDIILKDPSFTEQEKKPYKCNFAGCNAMFGKPSRLARHIRFHTGERNFKCDYQNCDKAYTNACHLKRHKTTHDPVKQLYKCSECSLYISNQHNLKRHYNTYHRDCDKLTCKTCGKSFVKKYQLKAHMSTHSPILHKCDECGKSFTNFTKYKTHKKSHKDGPKKYPCTMPGCNEVFAKWLLCCAHVKTQHVNDYKCKECGKVFLNKKHLKVHSQVHMENRSVISCPVEKCPRVYYFKSNLDHHIRSYHLGQKFECDICKIKVSTKQKIAKHIEKLHMSEKKVREIRKLQRKRRKDVGIPKRSAVSKLVGISLPQKIEKLILERKETLEYIESCI